MDELDLLDPPNLGLADLIDDPTSDTISSLQAVANVFTHGSPDDIFSILSELSRFLYICPDGLFDTILPALCPVLPDWPHDLQLATATELLPLCRFPNLPSPIAKLLALSSMQVIISLSRTSTTLIPQLLLTFGDILAVTLSAVKWTQQHSIRFLTLVDEYATSSIPDQRLVAVKVLRGFSACESSANMIESAILPRLWNMLPDNDNFISAQLISTLCALTQHYSDRKFFDRVWPKLLHLWDPSSSPSSSSSTSSALDGFAKSATVTAIANILSQKHTSVLFANSHLLRLASFFNYVTSFACQHSKNSITYLPESSYDCFVAVAAHLPTLVTFLSEHNVTHWQKNAVRAFSALSACDDPSIRVKCAMHLPQVCAALRGKNTVTLTRLAENFCTDENPDVRHAFALSFQQTISYLANVSTANLFRQMFQLLVDDDDNRVTVALVEGLGLTLKALSALKTSRPFDFRFGDAMQQIAMVQDWRTREMLAKQFGIAAKVLTPEQRQEILMLLKGLFRDGTAPVRRAAGASYLRVIRMIRSVNDRSEQMSSFFGEFCPAGCTIRLSLVDTIFYASDLFSAHAFSIMFAPVLLRMASDPVSNVRLKIASNLYRVAIACQAVASYSDTIRALQNDTDVDVRLAMDGFVDRAAAYVQNNKRLARRDARKLAFERWLYQDRFSISDPVPEPQTRAPRSEKSDKSAARRQVPTWAKRKSISQALSKVKVIFSRRKRKLKDHVTLNSSTRGASGDTTRMPSSGNIRVAKRLPTSGLVAPPTLSDATTITTKATGSLTDTTSPTSPVTEIGSETATGTGGATKIGSGTTGLGGGPTSAISASMVSSPLASLSIASASMNDDAGSDDWVRLPDRDMMDRFDEMSFSTASFGEIPSHWMSSQGSLATQSMTSRNSQNLEICGEYEPVKQPVSLPTSKVVAPKTAPEGDDSIEGSSRKSF